MATVLSVILASTSAGSIVNDMSSLTSANTGSPPFQTTACGVAAKVNDGQIPSPPLMPAARSMVLKATCPLEKTRVGTPRYSSSRRSNLTTQGPLLVTCPAASDRAKSDSIPSIGGNVGRAICRGLPSFGASLLCSLWSIIYLGSLPRAANPSFGGVPQTMHLVSC